MKIIKGLSKEGHNLTTLTMFEDNMKNKNGIHTLHLRETREILSHGRRQEINVLKFAEINPWTRIMLDYEFHLEFCRNLLVDSSYKTLLNFPKDFKFDLILYDSLSSPCLLGFYERFNRPPLIRIQSNYKDSLLNDENLSQSFENVPANEMNFKERVLNFIFRIFRRSFHERLVRSCNEMMDKYFPFLDLTETLKVHKIVLKNSHLIMRYPGEEASNDINVGGLHIRSNQSDRFFKTLRARNGIILFSLGNDINIRDLRTNILENIVLAFEYLSSYTIIWSSKEELEFDDFNLPENVLINHDYSQQEILEHPKTKLFIFPGDFLSIQESVWFGVPILGIPIFSYQKGVSFFSF